MSLFDKPSRSLTVGRPPSSVDLAPSLGVAFSTLELVGGALLIVGLGVRWLGLAFALEHVVTTFWVQLRLRGWPNGRVELMLLAGGIMLFLAGPGKVAIEAAWGGKRPPWRFWR